MNIIRLSKLGLCAAALTSCASTSPHPQAVIITSMPAGDAASPLEPCIAQALDFMVGTWDYTGLIARISGPSRTFVTRSTHANTDMENTWSEISVGGDMPEGEPLNYDRLRGNMLFSVVDGEEQIDEAQVFISCTGPDDAGRITTRSAYQRPLDEDGTEMLLADRVGTFTADGTYAHEYIKNADGDVIAYRSSVTVPAEDDSA